MTRFGRSRWSLLALATAVVCLGGDVRAWSTTGPNGAWVRSPAALDEAWSILLPRAEAGEPRAEIMSRDLAELGEGAAETLAAILFGDVEEPEVDYVVHRLAIDRRVDIVLDALKRLPAASAVAGVRARVESKPSIDRTLFGARMLGRVGGMEALAVLETMAPTLDDMQWQRPFVQTVFEEALSASIRSDPRAVRQLAEALVRCEPRCAPSFARALGATQLPFVVPVLLRVIGRNRDLDLCAMHELARFGDRGDFGPALGDLARLRSYCEGSDAGLKRAAACALAKLGDEEAIGPLIAMLDSRDALSVSITESSLKQLTGVALGKNSRDWNAWLQRETSWYETEFQVLQDDLASEDDVRIATAVRALASHRVYRHQAALAVRPLLQHAGAETQARVCTALGMYGSSRALPWLVEKLDSLEEDVRREAYASLRRLTGLDPGDDAEAWRPLVGG